MAMPRMSPNSMRIRCSLVIEVKLPRGVHGAPGSCSLAARAGGALAAGRGFEVGVGFEPVVKAPGGNAAVLHGAPVDDGDIGDRRIPRIGHAVQLQIWLHLFASRRSLAALSFTQLRDSEQDENREVESPAPVLA